MRDQNCAPDEGSDSRSIAEQEGHRDDRIDWAMAAITAQSIMTEALVHALCFELDHISRTRLLKTLDVVYNHLEDGLGYHDDVVKVFGEQRDSMRSLLISGIIQPEGDAQFHAE